MFYRLAWQSLGNISNRAAKQQFVQEIYRLASTVKPYVEACWADHLHQQQLQEEARLEQLRLQEEQQAEEKEQLHLHETRRQQEQTK